MRKNRTCGIYRILDLVSGNAYVGQSRHIEQRFSTHKNELRKGTHHNFRLQNHWKLYGEQRFKFEILEIVGEDMLTEREAYHIDKHRTSGLYNISLYPEPTKGTKRTEDQKKVLSDKAKLRWSKPEEREKSKNAALRAYKERPEIKNKLSKATKEQFEKNPDRKLKNDEHLRRLSSLNRRPILCLNTGEVFESCLSAANKLGLFVAGILDVVSGKYRHVKGYVFCDAGDEIPEERSKYKGLSNEEVLILAKKSKNKRKKVYRPSEHKPIIDGEELITVKDFCKIYAKCSIGTFENRLREGFVLPKVHYIKCTRWVKPSDVKEWLLLHKEKFNSKKPDRPVVCLDLAMKFDSATKAAKFIAELRGTTMRRSSISLACSDKYKVAYGMRWCYADKLNEIKVDNH